MKTAHDTTMRPPFAQRRELRQRSCSASPSCAALGHHVRAAVAALLLGSPFVAEGQGTTWYTVELVVFEHTDASHLDEEVWIADPGRPPIDESIELVDASGIALDGESGEGESSSPFAFRLLGPRHYRLNGVYGELQSSPHYRPLLHIAWRQPGLSKRRAKHAHVQGWKNEAVAPGGQSAGLRSRLVIDGTVELHIRKFVHLHADLLYYRDAPPARDDAGGIAAPSSATSPRTNEAGNSASPLDEPDSSSAFGSENAVVVSALPSGSSLAAAAPVAEDLVRNPAGASDFGTSPEHRWSADAGPPTAYRMTASRRMRRGELHYLDHPLFGVLALVTR